MVEGGDWLTPHYNYEERWQKPALYYWFAAGTMVGTGGAEFSARFGAALSGIGLVLLTWAAARRLTAREDAAWIAGAIAATCYGYFQMARLALPDLPLAFFITATIWSAMRATDRGEKIPASWAAVAGLAAGFGFLTKGPLAVVVPAIVLLPIWWRTSHRRTSHLAPRPGCSFILRLGPSLVRRDDVRARDPLSQELLSRRQPRTLRDHALQRPAGALVLRADRDWRDDALGHLPARAPVADAARSAAPAAHADRRGMAAGHLDAGPAAVVHGIGRQAAALHPARAAAAWR